MRDVKLAPKLKTDLFSGVASWRWKRWKNPMYSANVTNNASTFSITSIHELKINPFFSFFILLILIRADLRILPKFQVDLLIAISSRFKVIVEWHLSLKKAGNFEN